VFEVGLPGRWTAFTAAAVDGATFKLNETAAMYRAPVGRIDPQEKTVNLTLSPMLENGFKEDLVVSNDQMTKFWHISKAENGWAVAEGNMTEADFAPSNALRMWEYGVGDTVRMVTYVGLNRTAPGVFELHADTAVSLALKGRQVEISEDGKAWQPAKGAAQGEWFQAQVDPSTLPAGTLFLRVQ
jgi:hypothetical protein